MHGSVSGRVVLFRNMEIPEFGMNIARTGGVKDGYSPMTELILLCAAAISIAVTAAVHTSAASPQCSPKRINHSFASGQRPIDAAPSPARAKNGVVCLAHPPMHKAGVRRSWDIIEQAGWAEVQGS
jgi:hypothetical protein